MGIGSFFKGAVAGGVGAAVVMATSVALAGTGIGGVFNLGETNTVNETSTLSGSKAGPLLDVQNTNLNGAATAARFQVPSGRAPFAVTSSSLVKNLNSDQVDGYSASSLNRGTISSVYDSTVGGEEEVVRQVFINTSVNGFVKIDADVTIQDGGIGFAGGVASMVIRNDATGARSPESIANLPPGQQFGMVSVSRTWVVPVAAGQHSFSMILQPGPVVNAINESLVAQAQPFGWNGTGELSKPSGGISASSTRPKVLEEQPRP